MTTTDFSISFTTIRSVRAAALCVAAAMAGGCIADLDHDAATDRDAEVVEQAADVLGEFETADGVRITFTAEYESADADASPVVAITTLGPDTAYPYLADFGSRAATSLEAFLAVAPEGTAIPELVRSAHAREASLLGRSAEVRELSLAGPPARATVESASCDGYDTFQNSLASWTGEQTSASLQNHSLTRQGTGGNILAAMCNYNSDRVDYKYAQFCHEVTVQGSQFGLLVCDSLIVVPDGHRANKAWLGATTKRLVRAELLTNDGLVVISYIGIGGYVVP